MPKQLLLLARAAAADVAACSGMMQALCHLQLLFGP